MRDLRLPHVPGAPPRVLCLGAHCDDIELGCGGTLLRMRDEYPDVDIRWVIFCSDPLRRLEVMASASRFLGEEIDKRVSFENFREGFLPYEGAEVRQVFERIKAEFAPDLIFSHFRYDLHQDHRLVSELTSDTFRDHLTLEYEIPKWDGDLIRPNSYVHLEDRHVEEKIAILMQAYGSQLERAWYDPEVFRGLLRLRGVESNAPRRFAEAFYARKLVVGPQPAVPCEIAA